MGWINELSAKINEKLNPAQQEIYEDSGVNVDSTQESYNIVTAYENIPAVNRGVNFVADSAASINIDVKERIHSLASGEHDLRQPKIDMLINRKPNPHMDITTFRKNIYLDYILEGNIFLYFDGTWLYQLPAEKVEIVVDNKTYINHYLYSNRQKFYPNEIIHIKDNSARSIFRGDSRLNSALNNITVLTAMQNYQLKYFKNNTILGVVLKTPNSLSQKVKDRILNNFMLQHNASGGKRPILLDGDMTIDSLGNDRFRELDFKESTNDQEDQILKAIGVPPILLDSGNNANIAPNLRLFYIQTVLPIVNALVTQLEYFFGFDMQAVTGDSLALQPDLKDLGNYYSTLVNNGIMSQNEARESLRLEKSDTEGADDLIKPANVAGSASDSNQGGAPKKPEEDKE